MDKLDISMVDLEIKTVIFRIQENHLQILLVQSAKSIESSISKEWNIPGKRISENSSLELTSSTLIHQLTGVQETYQEQLYTYENLNQIHDSHLISIVYFSLIPAGCSDQLTNVDTFSCWFSIHSLPLIEKNYEIIIPYAIRRLRYKLEYSAVGFELLPEDFSLSQLQKIYEIILDEKLDKRNFRRRILEAGIIESTPHLKTGEGRPARLFRYKPDAIAEVKTRRLFP